LNMDLALILDVAESCTEASKSAPVGGEAGAADANNFGESMPPAATISNTRLRGAAIWPTESP